MTIKGMLFNCATTFIEKSSNTLLFGGDKDYELHFSTMSYSPWKTDLDFQNTYKVVKHYTLVDKYRCYDLWSLLAESSKCAAGDILEVGVWRGGTGALLANRAKLMGLKAMTYLCDTFEGVVKAGSRDNFYRGGEHADTSESLVREVLGKFNTTEVEILKGIFPEESSDPISDRTFRFCHIDVDVYDSAKGVIDWVWPRMLPGGIVVFDDFGFHTAAGVTKLVNEWMAKNDAMVVQNLNGHGVVIKTMNN